MTVKLTAIISVSGKSGLFKIIARGRNGLIVESLIDQKRFPVFASQKVSALEDITIFTTGENVPLGEVFFKMMEKSGGDKWLAEEKDAAVLRKALNELIPLDNERVSDNDVKKIFNWFNLLTEKKLLEVEQPSVQEESTGVSEQESPEEASNTEKKSATKKSKKTKTKGSEEGEETKTKNKSKQSKSDKTGQKKENKDNSKKTASN